MLSGQVRQKWEFCYPRFRDSSSRIAAATGQRHKLSFDSFKGVAWKWIPPRGRGKRVSLQEIHTAPADGRTNWNSSYQSEENNNPGIDLSLARKWSQQLRSHCEASKQNYSEIFSVIGVSPPPLLLYLLIDPLPFSLPLFFPIFSFVSLHSYSLLPVSLSLSLSFFKLMNLKLGGIARPSETCSLLGPYFLLHNVFTPWSAGGIQLSITLLRVPANTFTTFKLAAVTASRATTLHVSRCCRLPFFFPRLLL